MYALVEIKGKQYRVSPGIEVVVDRMPDDAERVEFDSVLMVADGDRVQIGEPYVQDARVRARVSGHERGRKVTVSTYRKRKRHHRTRGHRQRFTRLLIEDVEASLQEA